MKPLAATARTRRPTNRGGRTGPLAAAVLGLLAASGAASPAVARDAAPRPAAILLLDRAPADAASAEAELAAARPRLEMAWRIEDAAALPDLARPDPDCGTDARAARATEVLRGLRDGVACFYDQTDVEGARTRLQAAVDRFLQAPCALAGNAGGRSEAVAGAVLLVRLHLLAGRPEAAADLGRRLLRTFGADELAAVDVPPEVTAFLDRVREDASAAAVSLDLAVTALPAGTRLLLDGREVAPGPRPVARGRHALTVLSAAGARTRRVAVDGPLKVVLDPALALALLPGPAGTLVPDPDVAPLPDLARRLAQRTGRTVLRVTGAGGSGPVEVAVAAQPGGTPPADPVLRLQPSDHGGPFVAIASGPLVRRKAWPWPWVTGAAAAGLLGGAIALNVLANRDAAAVNAGTNRLSDWRARRAGSIACYALAAAAGAGTVVLAVLGRPAPQRVVLSPIPGGAAVGIRGAF